MTYLLSKGLSLYKPINKNETSIAMMQAYFPGMIGVGSDKLLNSAIKSSLGEQLERFALFKGTSRNLESVPALNLLTLNSEIIPSNFIRMIDNSERFTDSTGAAAGSTSKNAIQHGFFEFVERQSFIFSFLTKNKGKLIDSSIIKKSGIDVLSLKRNYEITTIREISIYPNIKVIILIALNSKTRNFVIGLGSDFNIKKAIQKAYNEALEGFNDNKTSNNKRHYLKNSGQEYSQRFYNQMSPEKMYEAYKFLFEKSSSTIVLSSNKKPKIKQSVSINDIHDFAVYFNSRIYLSFINNPRIGNKIKTIKIFSPDMYPHINTELINPSNYSFSFFKDKNQKFPNKGKYLPFP